MAADIHASASLEKLASNFDRVNDNRPANLMQYTPKQKVSFIREVFQQSGYNFSATLKKLVEEGTKEQNAHDLADLMLLPMRQQSASPKLFKDLYGEKSGPLAAQVWAKLYPDYQYSE